MNLRIGLFLTSAVIAFLSLILSGCSGTSPEYSKYKSDLNYQMQDMINVLNAGHRNEFLSKYVDPSYLQRMGGVDAALVQFTDKRARALQTALKVAKQIQPTYDEAAKQVSYFSQELVNPIVFKQKGGKWYLQDDWLKN